MAMIELASRILIDLGMARSRAIMAVGLAGILFGIPSALKLGIFQNQDWVWGVGLMVSGFFFAFAVLRYGVTKWREKFINQEGSDIRIGAWWDWAMRLVAVEAIVLALWWLWEARSDDVAATWTLFSPYNVGTVLIQFVIVVVILWLANNWLAKTVQARWHNDAAMPE